MLPVGNIFHNNLKSSMLKSPIISSEAGGGEVALQICETVRPLSPNEEQRFARCEEILKQQLGAVFQAGLALLTIREEKLYRGTHSTFESYCRDRWGVGRSYVWRIIGAAERVRLLPADLPKPANEFQIRPFLKLDLKIFPTAWEQTVKRAKHGKITAEIIRSVVIELSPKTTRQLCSSLSPEPLKNFPRGALGRILLLLQDARRRVKNGDEEGVLSDLDDIEAVLFESSKSSRNQAENST